MQEEVENRTLTLTVNATKFTGRVLKAALSKYLAHRKNKKLQKSRDSPDDEVEQDSQQDGQHGERGGVYAAFQAEALQRACALFLEFLHGQSPFQFQRRFSMPCAVKKRKSTAVVR